MARLFKPPAPLPGDPDLPCVFLAGSIDQGRAEDWQSILELALDDLEVGILNPRRDAWDSSWIQSEENPLFREQVSWELSGLERADVVAFYFAPTSRAPISLLELGLVGLSGRAVVCCPEGYWRKGNIDIVCSRYGIERATDLMELAARVRYRLLLVRPGEAGPASPATPSSATSTRR